MPNFRSLAPRGGWKRFKRYVNILQTNAFFCWVFHVTLNGHDTLVKKRWGSAGLTRYSDYTSRKHHGDVLCFVKALAFRGEINKLRFDAFNFTRLIS